MKNNVKIKQSILKISNIGSYCYRFITFNVYGTAKVSLDSPMLAALRLYYFNSSVTFTRFAHVCFCTEKQCDRPKELSIKHIQVESIYCYLLNGRKLYITYLVYNSSKTNKQTKKFSAYVNINIQQKSILFFLRRLKHKQ